MSDMPEIMGTIPALVEMTIPENPIEESSRKLATIRRIGSVEDIVFKNAEGIDEVAANIVLVKVDGWQLVTQRSNGFAAGDMCVYFEIDSILPKENPEFAFLERYKYRLRTIKLKGQLSQGLVLPVDIVVPGLSELLSSGALKIEVAEGDAPEFLGDYKNEAEVQEYLKTQLWSCLEGYDVTDILGITKYEADIPANLRGKIKGNFPSFLRKTDEERIQNVPNFLSKYQGLNFYVTEKLDGSSFTAYYKDGAFGVCSRNLDLLETEDNTFWQLARKIGLEEKMAGLGKNIAIQGEMVGPGIQKNPYGLSEVALYVFNLFDIDRQEFYSFRNMRFALAEMELRMVPVLAEDIPLQFDDVKTILSYADGKSHLNGKVAREGMVWRPTTEIRDDRHGRVSWKVISNSYLLGQKD